MKRLSAVHPTLGRVWLAQTMCDTCVWVIKSDSGQHGWIVTYVDDILAVAAVTVGQLVIHTIMDHWKCSDMEELNEAHPEMGFLGMNLRFVPGKGYFVHQVDYVKGLVKRYNLENCNPTKVIMPSDECLDSAEEQALAAAKLGEGGRLIRPPSGKRRRQLESCCGWPRVRAWTLATPCTGCAALLLQTLRGPLGCRNAS